MVGRRRRRDLRDAGEDDHPDAQPFRSPVEEEPDRALRGTEARGLDVARLHRAGDVEDEHDGGAVLRHEPADVRSRETGDERREREQNQHGRDVAPPRSTPCDLPENREVGEADRVPRAPALQHDVEPREQRQREQPKQRPGALEGQRPVPAQSACTWTTALTRSETSAPTTTATRPPRTVRLTETDVATVEAGAVCV